MTTPAQTHSAHSPAPIFRLSVDDHLMIAHSLPDPFFGPAQNLHGATLGLTLTLERMGLTPQAVVMDIGAAQGVLSEALEPLRYRNLDEVDAFIGTFSTTEAVCHHIATEVLRLLPEGHGLRAVEVAATENPQARASVRLELDAVSPHHAGPQD